MATETIAQKTCSLTECEKRVHNRGLCSKHYGRWYRQHKKDGTEPWLRNPQRAWNIESEEFAQYFWSRIAVTANEDECWEWQYCRNPQGYGAMTVSGRNIRSHRIAWWLANGREPILDVLHSCDNPPCCNPKHLREGTRKDNYQDAVDRGRIVLINGERHHGTYLAEQEIRQIKQWYADGDSTTTIRQRTGLTRKMLWNIHSGRTWKHIQI